MLIGLSGCATVSVSNVDSREYVKQRRGDVLTTGTISQYTGVVLQILGLDQATCQREAAECAEILSTGLGLTSEQRLSAMAELWLHQALWYSRPRNKDVLAEVDAYLMSARYAYAYLFYSGVTPINRLFEDRQTQVRDYYNFATQQAATLLFSQQQRRWLQDSAVTLQTERWQLRSQLQHRRFREQALPAQLVPTNTLSFQGLRNQYRRDGLGAELVAVSAAPTQLNLQQGYSELPSPVVTAVLSFGGNTLAEVLGTDQVTLHVLDPLQQQQVTIAGAKIPLAANFTAGYGLWLARSDFSRQAFWNLMGASDSLAQPHLFMLQPYDPNRKIIIMLHGIASSPEAWVNTANEVLGDEKLRANYQLWQLYYPTNLPLVLNLQAIRQRITQTLRQFDPEGLAPASEDIVIIGHSMGGLLTRLLVSDSGEQLLYAVSEEHKLDLKRQQRFFQSFREDFTFSALPGANRAIFIATPHLGTAVADYRLARWLAGLITLPVTVLERVAEAAELLNDPSSKSQARVPLRITSIENLSDSDSFIMAAARIPINAAVRYHSIIGVEQPSLPVAQHSDGVVPYLSAHLPEAQSEMVIRSGHSVQETSAAILEIRRILHQHLAELTR
ncbi:triacylglycerol lipase [Alishewanella sp. SMS8]|uniref:esterase/lipase family protein n=1 Tax=Alishewanella sp. SMS8 TaxID=2994676 RepID=UPI002741EAB2|nr:alpha/beta fold hydrolase [Alishewanella sp. SMS8]MDP4944953.1 alpha/beta fold hydrolase [Alishewanella sp.]MDP5207040.1 alpha/beta fold hydrolase [Alishewanella sp. SMS9]MDP5035992.1 alpha/beta fold hydrolase [Alishewanella sp.]MDP5185896.1 alpha/beta fold hydrolase [Alishewanella sp.]MDP5459769.1 alpha/beta fold hydrolase [Alishewanella sp. SMS8]